MRIEKEHRGFKRRLHTIIFEADTPAGKAFDVGLLVAIVLSIVIVMLESVNSIQQQYESLFNNFEWIFTLIFTIEYLLRIWITGKPLKYIFSFYGIIDLLAILPFYLKGAYDLRALRVFRIFRIFRAFKLIRYNRALNRFHIATKIVKEEMILFFIITFIFVFLASSGIYFFENEAQPELFSSVFHSGWWAIATLTTVGYGDIYPITMGGKIFTFFILLIGVGVVTVPAGLVASALSQAREIEEKERKN